MPVRNANPVPDAPLPNLALRMMGPFAVTREDGVVPVFRSQKTKWLLAFLALQQGGEVEFALLNTLFWADAARGRTAAKGGSSGKDEFANLRQSLVNLRAALSPQRFAKPSRCSVRLLTDALTVDLYAFDAAIRKGTDEGLRQAVECYTGDLLADCSGGWVKAERDRRRQEYIRALKTLAANDLAAGDFDRAEQCLRRLTAAEPYREEWVVELTRLLCKRGETDMARQVQEQYLALRPKLKWKPDSKIVKLGAALAPAAGGRPLPPALHAANEAAVSPRAEEREFTPGDLPSVPEPLIGREEAVREIAARLRFSHMVTLKGPLGIGKTQLALRVCDEMRDDYPDGILFLDVTACQNLRDVLHRLTSRLQVPRRSDATPQETLVAFLHSRRMLLALDACEHLVGAITPFLKTLLLECPGVRLLTTSQSAWRDISAQYVCHVKGLSVPEPEHFQGENVNVQALLAYHSVRLYLREAANVQPDISLTPENARAVAQLCHHLDGSPLGIKLAASQAQTRSPSATLAALLHDPRSLDSPHADLPRRQRSLWSAIESGFGLLPADLQRAFACLAVFPGSWTVEAAQAVVDSPFTGALLQQMADRSLIATLPAQEPFRFQMQKITRCLAGERLSRLPEAEAVRQRFVAYCLRFTQQREARFAGPEQDAAFDEIAQEWDNLQAALEWAETEGSAEQGLQMASLLWRYWFFRGDNLAGAAWLQRMLARCPDAPAELRAGALQAAGNLAFRRADYERARAYYREQLRLEETLGDYARLARNHGNLGNVGMMLRDHEGARKHLETCGAFLERIGDHGGLSMTLGNLAILARQMGNFALACRYHAQAIPVLERLGDSHNHVSAINNFADTQLLMEDYAAVAKTLRQSLCLCLAANYRLEMVQCLFLHARLALEIGMWEMAARFLGAARAARERDDLVLHVQAAAEQRQCCDTIRAHIGMAALDCALDEGRVMSTAELAACAEDIYARASD